MISIEPSIFTSPSAVSAVIRLLPNGSIDISSLLDFFKVCEY